MQIVFFFFCVVWIDVDVVEDIGCEGCGEVDGCQWFLDVFLEFDGLVDFWVFWQVVVQIWFVGMVQYVYDVGVIDVGWIVQVCIVIIVGFQFSYVFVGQCFYIFFGVKVDCVGWIGFYVGRFLVDGYVVYVQGIFVDVVVFWVQMWYIEWIVGDIVVVVDVLFGLEVDNIVGVLNDCVF